MASVCVVVVVVAAAAAAAAVVWVVRRRECAGAFSLHLIDEHFHATVAGVK